MAAVQSKAMETSDSRSPSLSAQSPKDAQRRPPIHPRYRLSWRSALLRLLATVLLCPSIVLSAVVWGQMIDVDFTALQTRQNAPQTNAPPAIILRTPAEVLNRMGAHSPIHPAVNFFLFGMPITTLVLLLIGVACVPFVVANDGEWAALGRGVRSVASSCGTLLLGFAAGAFGIAWAARQSTLQTAGAQTLINFDSDDHVPEIAFAIVTVIWLIMSRITHAAWRTGRDIRQALPAPAPACEDCGYDLAHRPENGRCPECSLALEESLEPGRRRMIAWDARIRGAFAWLHAGWNALVRPTKFYESLPVMTAYLPHRSFTLWTLLLIGAGAAVWYYGMIVVTPRISGFAITSSAHNERLLAVAIGLIVPLAGRLTQLGTAALAGFWIAARGTPAQRVGWRRVMDFESIWLFVFCLYDGPLVMSFYWFPHGWRYTVTPLVTPLLRAIGHIPAEAAAILYGNGALILLWLWRYRIALRGVRWANF